MIDGLIYGALAIFGATFGSFAAATVWRIRARQLEADKKAGQEYDKKEYAKIKKLTGKTLTKDRSQCLHCNTTLRWFELIPVVSWVVQRGRCRSCGIFIGWFEILAECGLALFFVLSYALWPVALGGPLEITQFALWLVSGIVLLILFAYDTKWMLLPDAAMIALIVAGAGITATTAALSGDAMATVVSALAAAGVLGGLYGALYLFSKGRWVGLGDAILGVGLGLLLVRWELALVALFMANFIGCLIVIPLMATKKLKRDAHVPFGPLLIAGTLVAIIFGNAIVEWYVGGMGIVL